MLFDSRQRTFEAVLVYKLDGFARNRYDSAINTLVLRNNGVKVVSATKNISDKPKGRLVENVIIGVNGNNLQLLQMLYKKRKTNQNVIRNLFHNNT